MTLKTHIFVCVSDFVVALLSPLPALPSQSTPLSVCVVFSVYFFYEFRSEREAHLVTASSFNSQGVFQEEIQVETFIAQFEHPTESL